MGEPSTVAVVLLFTDLVGSTALGSSRSAEAGEALRRTHFALLREAVEATGGREVKNLGDGLMVVFTSASRALACSVGMQQAIDRHNRRHRDDQLAVRIGIAGGETTEDDGDYFGDPVIEAARLCAVAEGGQVLATEVVQAMAGRHAPIELVAVGELDLKGLPQPVAAVEARWDVLAAGTVPLPTRLRPSPADAVFSFFGRAAEIAALDDARKRATAGELQVVFVSGEPGMGKTTLAAHAARAAHTAGATVLFGACDEGFGTPLQPWVTALTHLVRNQPTIAEDLLDVHRAALRHLLPSAFDGVAAGAPSDRQLLLDAVAHLLEAATAEAPVVLLLDDLQWADATSLEVLRYVVRACPLAACLIVATYRSSELARGAPLASLLADLWRVPSTVRLDLVGLSDAELVTMLEVTAGHDMPTEGVALAHALRRETGGNPFFTVELLRHLSEVGAFELGDDGRYSLVGDAAELALPNSIREVVGHRVARLGDDVVAVLSTAAVIGLDFELVLLASVTEQDEDELIDVLERATAAGLVVESMEVPGGYRFVHALIAHTLAQDLGVNRRRRTHERIALALEALDEHDERVGELARHWLAATRPADAQRAVHYAIRAGDQALEALAPLDAVSWFRQGLDLHERQPGSDETTHGRLLARLALAQMTAGDRSWPQTRTAAGTVALRIGDPDLLVEVALCNIQGYGSTELPDAEHLRLIEAALATLGPEDSVTRARLLINLADEHDNRDVDERTAAASEAQAIAQRLGAEGQLIEVITDANMLRAQPDTLEDRTVYAQLAVDMARRSSSRIGLLTALDQLGSISVERADRELMDRCWAEADELREGLGVTWHRWVGMMRQAFVTALDGDLVGGEALTNAAFELGVESGISPANAVFGAQLLTLRQQQGRLAEVVGFVEESREQGESLPAWAASLAFVYSELGWRDHAAPMLEREVSNGFEGWPKDTTWLMALVNWGDCAILLDHEHAAALLAARLAPYTDRIIYPGSHTFGAISRVQGLLLAILGDLESAEAMLRKALAIHEGFRAPYWIARTRLDLAGLLQQRDGSTPEVSALAAAASHAVEEFEFAGLRGYGTLGD